MKKIDTFLFKGYAEALAAKENFTEYVKSEKGISDLVATIIVLLMVVIIVGVFWEGISEWLGDIINRILGSGIDDGTLVDEAFK